MNSRFNNFYRSIVSQNTQQTNLAAEKNETKKTDKEDTPTILKTNTKDDSAQSKTQTNSQVKTLEKDFLNKFIRYNELQLLMKDLPDIANSFKAVQGFDEQLIKDTVEKLLKERQKEMDNLTTQLTDLRTKITKEAQIANYKKSVIDIFNNQSKSNEEQSPYGYIEKTSTPDAFKNGETIAAQNGVPTTNIVMPAILNQPAQNTNDIMEPEQLPVNNTPDVVDDLTQAIEKNADAVEPLEQPVIPRKKVTKKPILIDSKKSKKTKK